VGRAFGPGPQCSRALGPLQRLAEAMRAWLSQPKAKGEAAARSAYQPTACTMHMVTVASALMAARPSPMGRRARWGGTDPGSTSGQGLTNGGSPTRRGGVEAAIRLGAVGVHQRRWCSGKLR
jgi:hypothetical protein